MPSRAGGPPAIPHRPPACGRRSSLTERPRDLAPLHAGWAGYGESRNSIAAFLFRISPGGDARSAAKLPKVGSAGLSVIDEEEKGPRFGPDGLVIELAKGSERTAISRLGNAYERLPDGSKSLFIDEGGISAELVDLKVLSGVYEKDEIVPYSGALPGQLG